MLSGLFREAQIKRVLRKLAGQRVAMHLADPTGGPGIWVIEKAVMHDDETDAIMMTCWMRGWVEPIEKAMPRGKLNLDGKIPPGQMFDSVGPIYRLTDSGWTVIRRAHGLLLFGNLVALLSLLATVLLTRPS